MKAIIISLIVIISLLSYKLVLGSDSVIAAWKLRNILIEQDKDLNKLKLRNQLLLNKLERLKKYSVAIEEQARYELGMVKHGEKYYQVVDPIE